MDAVTFVRATGDDLAEEDDRVVPFANGDVPVLHAAAREREFGELVVVRGEEGAALGLVVQKLGDAPRDAQAIERARAASDFIEDHEAARRGVIADVGGLVHLDHESALPAREVVVRADAGKNAIGNSDFRLLRGHPRSDLRHENEERDLADVGAFSGHVRAGDDEEAVRGVVERGVVGDEFFLHERLIQNGVATIGDADAEVVADLWSAVAEKTRGFGEAGEDIERGDGGCGGLKRCKFAQDFVAELDEKFVFQRL